MTDKINELIVLSYISTLVDPISVKSAYRHDPEMRAAIQEDCQNNYIGQVSDQKVIDKLKATDCVRVGSGGYAFAANEPTRSERETLEKLNISYPGFNI